MKITMGFLKEQNACPDGYEWFINCGETEHEPVINKLIAENHLAWANWCIVRLMTHKQCIQYAVFAAEMVLENFEKKYPDDDRPRKAVEAAKACLNNAASWNADSAAWSAVWSTARNAAWSAENAARSAVWSAARNAAWSAENAACSAENAACSAVWSAARNAAWSAENAARNAAWSAARSAENADSAVLETIIVYGLSLLNGL